MMDPRPAAVAARLGGVRRILAVTGGKGGIGKSVVASTLSLVATGRGVRTGLLDLDLTSPCDHLLLGMRDEIPEERFGVEPPAIHGVRLMSVVFWSGRTPAPLRGQDFSNALVELLAITRWGELDLLVVDMPPGISDAALDAARLLGRAEHLVVATDSRVVLETVRRTLSLLRRVRTPILGVLENMSRDGGDAVRELAREHDVEYLGALPWDAGLEPASGDPTRLAHTALAAELGRLAERLM